MCVCGGGQVDTRDDQNMCTYENVIAKTIIIINKRCYRDIKHCNRAPQEESQLTAPTDLNLFL